MAYGIARARPSTARNVLLMLVILPFWTSFLLRVYAWIGILQDNGLLNQAAAGLGSSTQPLAILHTDLAVYIGIVYCYLPFMILPLYAKLEQLDLGAARGRGRPRRAPGDARSCASPCRCRCRASSPGSLLVFIPAVGEFVIPDLLGGPRRADDRPRALDRVLRQPRLADGRGGGGGAAGPARAADAGLPVSCRTAHGRRTADEPAQPCLLYPARPSASPSCTCRSCCW